MRATVSTILTTSTISATSISLAVALAGFLSLAVAAPVQADDRAMIDANVTRALDWVRGSHRNMAKLLKRSAGVLVFPDMVKMGFGVGGEFGEGALIVDGDTQGYYAVAGKEFGVDQKTDYKAQVIFFRTKDALKVFLDSRSWKVGKHARVPILSSLSHPEKSIDRSTPVVGIVFSPGGLLAGLRLDGSKITRISR